MSVSYDFCDVSYVCVFFFHLYTVDIDKNLHLHTFFLAPAIHMLNPWHKNPPIEFRVNNVGQACRTIRLLSHTDHLIHIETYQDLFYTEAQNHTHH